MNGFFSEIQTKSPISSTCTNGEELVTTTTESEQTVTVLDTTETQTKDGIIILVYILPIVFSKIQFKEFQVGNG